MPEDELQSLPSGWPQMASEALSKSEVFVAVDLTSRMDDYLRVLAAHKSIAENRLVQYDSHKTSL
jgi:hypothetical protein